MSLGQTAEWVHGVWSSEGEYRPLFDDQRQWLLSYNLFAAVRLNRNLELGAEVGYGTQSFSSPSFASRNRGIGDTTLRVRWEFLAEPMPYEHSLWPGVTLVPLLRVPTGEVRRIGEDGSGAASGTTGSLGSTASSQGLGTWEPGLGVDLQKSFLPDFRFNLFGMLALRTADDALGVHRQLGPRAQVQLSARYFVDTLLSLGATTRLGWEGEVEIDDRRLQGTAQRLWTVGAFINLSLLDPSFKSGVMIEHAPKIEAISATAVGSTAVSVSIAYAL